MTFVSILSFSSLVSTYYTIQDMDKSLTERKDFTLTTHKKRDPKVSFLSDFLAVQHGFQQFVAAVAQGQQEEGRILPQQVQEDLIAFPFGKVI